MTFKKYGKVILSALIFVIFTAITGYSMGITFGKDAGKETAMATIDARVEKALEDAKQQIDELSKENRNLLEENNKKNNSNEKEDKKNNTSSTKKKISRKKTSSTKAGSGNQKRTGGSAGNASIPNKLKDGVYEGEGQGYAGIVKVKVTVFNGKISDITVLSHKETSGYYENGAKVIGKILSAQSTNVDSISGATYTSDAIKMAVANALRNAGDTNSSSSTNLESLVSQNNKYKKEVEELKNTIKTLNKEIEKKQKFGKLKDGTYQGEGRGYKSTIRVSVRIVNSKISKIDVLEHGEDNEFFNRAKQILKEIVSKGSTNVNTISNATKSSNGIKLAINDALGKASGSSNDSEIQMLKQNIEVLSKEKNELNNKIDELNKTLQEKNDDIARLNSNKPLKDGTYRGEGRGFQNGITVVEVKIESGKIKDVKIVSSDDDQEYLDKNKLLIENIISKNSVDVDTITGATKSSNGIKSAVSDALKKAISSNVQNSFINDLESKIKQLKNIITNKDAEIDSKDKIIKEKDHEIEILKKKINGNSDSSDANNNIFKIPKDKKGKFTGRSKGHYGREIVVEVEVLDGLINDIKILKNSDDAPYFEIARNIEKSIKSKNYSDLFEGYNEYEKLSDMIMKKDKNLPKEINEKVVNLQNPGTSNKKEFNEYVTEVSGIIKSYLSDQDKKTLDIINTTSGATRSTIGILNAVKNALSETP